MRRLIFTAAAVLALVGAGIATAWDSNNGKSIKEASATFTATTAANVRTNTCTATDGTYATSRGDYTGTATGSDPSLTGNVTVHADSVINTTTGFGTVDGKLRIDTADGKHTEAQFDAVYKAGHIAGLAEGHGSAGPWNQLVANLSADYTAAGGFANGLLGGATTGGDGVLVSSGGCKQAPPTKPDTIEVHGTISAASATSITAAGVTCAVPTTLATVVAALTVGGHVDMKCTVSGTTNTLVSVGNDHNSNHDSVRHH